MENKTITLAIVGLVVGGILGAVVGGDNSIFTYAPFGGVIGFLVGWIWQSRGGESK